MAAAKMTPMQLRAATQKRNSILTALGATGVVTGIYYYTLHAMAGLPHSRHQPPHTRPSHVRPCLCTGRSLDDVDIDKYRTQPEAAGGMTTSANLDALRCATLSPSAVAHAKADLGDARVQEPPAGAGQRGPEHRPGRQPHAEQVRKLSSAGTADQVHLRLLRLLRGRLPLEVTQRDLDRH
jgi:hypothetical protein